MKVLNYMNFVRHYEPRMGNDALSREVLYETTVKQLELAREFNIDSTFLLQYDALIDERYIELFKDEANEHTELGLWFEIARPLTDKVGLEWRGEDDVTWDWKIIPGFPMAYTQEERKAMIDEAMNTFREIYGFYPKSVASWLIDTYSAQYLSEQYDISMLAFCRDQTNTDAYTLIGGYFNQAYYPSKNNIFTPAQSADNQIKTPAFRLLGPDPVHNYDDNKYSGGEEKHTCYTLEPVWETGREPEIVDWFIRTYYDNEDLGFSYAQIGQENSFGTTHKFLPALRMQLEKFTKRDDIVFQTMRDTGEWFKKTYATTPATCVTALDDWATGDDSIQSIYYDCQKYVANIFRHKNKIFIRCLYLFDDRNTEYYLTKPCETWNATYENLPVIDTLIWDDNDGLLLDTDAVAFTMEKTGDSSIKVSWGDKEVSFCEDGIHMKNITATFNTNGNQANIVPGEQALTYTFNDIPYSLSVEGGKITTKDGVCTFTPDENELHFSVQ